jgi:hypothetical protein
MENRIRNDFDIDHYQVSRLEIVKEVICLGLPCIHVRQWFVYGLFSQPVGGDDFRAVLLEGKIMQR